MKKPKITYQEKYRSGAMMVKQDSLPKLNHIPPEYIIKSCEIQSAAALDDGTNFQILKVVMKEGVIS